MIVAPRSLGMSTKVVEFESQYRRHRLVVRDESIVIERVSGRDALGVERWNEVADLVVDRGMFDTIVRTLLAQPGGERDASETRTDEPDDEPWTEDEIAIIQRAQEGNRWLVEGDGEGGAEP